MKIELAQEQGLAIATLDGRLRRGAGEEALHELIDELLADGHRKILLDLSQVTSIDSSGIGELVAGLKVVREMGAQLKILSLPEGIRHVLTMAQLLPMFDVYRTKLEALEAFEVES